MPAARTNNRHGPDRETAERGPTDRQITEDRDDRERRDRQRGEERQTHTEREDTRETDRGTAMSKTVQQRIRRMLRQQRQLLQRREAERRAAEQRREAETSEGHASVTFPQPRHRRRRRRLMRQLCKEGMPAQPTSKSKSKVYREHERYRVRLMGKMGALRRVGESSSRTASRWSKSQWTERSGKRHGPHSAIGLPLQCSSGSDRQRAVTCTSPS
jgi:hypothetical protein